MRNQGYKSLEQEYGSLASRYDRRWWRYIDASVHETLKRLEVAAGHYVLDVGCGTGALLELLARRQPRGTYIGTDLSGEMLAVARRRLPGAVALHRAAAESLPLAGATVDLLVSTSVFHFVRGPDLALQEMRRVLKPGGKLVITDWCRDYLSCKLLNRYLRRFSPAHYHMYGSSEVTSLLKRHGFERIHLERYKISWLWGLFTATATNPRPLARTPSATVTAYDDQVAGARGSDSGHGNCHRGLPI
ncbi:MAG: class I SAM-dependent methyltransferase [Wenzhouxiangellaceae bacterium]|nr:class I SAM-dependent methyltransferase [Wenzhouxiangellaceae bacterium]